MRLDDFFADPKRSGSPERSLGSGWTSPDEDGVTYTVYWIEKTCEVYGVRHPPVAFGPGTPKPYGAYMPTFSVADEDSEVRLLGTIDADAVADVGGEAERLTNAERSLAWLESRARRT